MELPASHIGKPYTDAVKVTGAGYPVLRNGRWLVACPVILDRTDLLRMLKALDGMGDGDFDGDLAVQANRSQRPG